jgi:hypothetical protein
MNNDARLTSRKLQGGEIPRAEYKVSQPRGESPVLK